MKLSEKQLVFIGGLHRSGTSILFQCLRSHPDCSGFHDTGVPEDEGQHLQSVYPIARAHGGPGRFCFDSKAFLKEDSLLVSDKNRETLLREWSNYWDINKKVLLEKSPPNLVRGRFLQALFPQAKFIFILRHPLAVSFATQKWSKTPLHQLLAHWMAAHVQMNKDLPFLKQVKIIHYEDFVSDPEKVLDELQEFIGIQKKEIKISVKKDINESYFSIWHNLKNSGWKNKLYCLYICLRFNVQVKKFNYYLRCFP